MKFDIKNFLLRLYAIIIGSSLGTILGVIVFGAAIRIVLDLLFQWGDSGPVWVNWLIFSITILSVFASTYIAVKRVNSFIDKNS